MTLPVAYDVSAEQLLGTASLELVRSRVRQNVLDNPDLTFFQRRKILKELDWLIECEQKRRARLAVRQWEKEELEHKTDMLEKQVQILSKLRILKARTELEVFQHQRDALCCKIEIMERLLHLKAKCKPVEKEDNSMKELIKIKQQLKLSDIKDQAIIKSITRRAMNRAAFIKMVNNKFPDMAEELLDFYDQQTFQHGVRR